MDFKRYQQHLENAVVGGKFVVDDYREEKEKFREGDLVFKKSWDKIEERIRNNLAIFV